MVVWLSGCLAGWLSLAGCLIVGLTDGAVWLAVWLSGWLVAWLFGWLSDCRSGKFANSYFFLHYVV